MPVAQGQMAVGVTLATLMTRSVAVAVPVIVLEPEHAALPTFGCEIVKLPATVAAAGNETVPVVRLPAAQVPLAVVAA